MGSGIGDPGIMDRGSWVVGHEGSLLYSIMYPIPHHDGEGYACVAHTTVHHYSVVYSTSKDMYPTTMYYILYIILYIILYTMEWITSSKRLMH